MNFLNLKSIVLALLVCMAGTFFASCGGDDDNNDDITIGGGGDSDNGDNQSSYAKLVVGDWTVIYEDDGLCKVEVTFTSNGQYIAKDYYMQGDGTWSSPSEYSGTYNVYGKTVNMVDKSDKFPFAGKLDIINMTDKDFTLESKEYNTTFRGEKTTATTESPIVGSWKDTYNCTINGITYLCYDIIKLNNDGSTGTIYYYEAGKNGSFPISYVYDSDKKILNIRNENSKGTEIYKVKSISRTKLVLVLLADDYGEFSGDEEEIYYRI